MKRLSHRPRPARETPPTVGSNPTSRGRNECLGMPVLKVREIVRIQEITPLPPTASASLGGLELRGKVIPILDLRLHRGTERPENGARACIVVVEVDLGTRNAQQLGIAVDGAVEAKADDASSR